MRLDQMPLEVQKQMLETAKTEIEFHTQFLEVWKEEIRKEKSISGYKIDEQIKQERYGYFSSIDLADDAKIDMQTVSLKSATDSITSQIGKIEIQIAFKKTSASVSISRSSGGGAKTRTWPQNSFSGRKHIKFDAEFGILADDLNQFYERLQDFSAYEKITAYNSSLKITELEYNDLPTHINKIKSSPGFPIIADNAGKPNLPSSYDEGYPIKKNGTGSTWYISFKETTGLGINFELDNGSSKQTISEAEFSADQWALDISSPNLVNYKTVAESRRLTALMDSHGTDWWKGYKDTVSSTISLHLGNQLFFTYSGTFKKSMLFDDFITGNATYEKLSTVPVLTNQMIGTAAVTDITDLLKTKIWNVYRDRLLATTFGAVNIEFEVGDPFKFVSQGHWIYATLLMKQADPSGKLQYYFRVRDTSTKISGLTSSVAAAASKIFSGITKGTASIIPSGTLTTVTNALNAFTYDKNHFYEVDDTYMQTFSFDLNSPDVDDKAKKDEPILRELATVDPLVNYARIIQLTPTLFYKNPDIERNLIAATAAKNTADAKEIADLNAAYATISGSSPSDIDRKKEILRKLQVLDEDKLNGDTITDLLAALDTTPLPPSGTGPVTTYELMTSFTDAQAKVYQARANDTFKIQSGKVIYTGDFFVAKDKTLDITSTTWSDAVFVMKPSSTTNSVTFRNIKSGKQDTSVKYTQKSPQPCKKITDAVSIDFIKNYLVTNDIPDT